MTKKYYIDFTTLVVDDKSFNKITSDNFNRKEFFKQLIDDDILEIVSTDKADEYDEADDLSKYLGDER